MNSLLIMGIGAGICVLTEEKELRDKIAVWCIELYDTIKTAWNKPNNK